MAAHAMMLLRTTELDVLPQFPEFKPLALSDRDCVRRHTASYPPFSDFNFTSLWSWNVDNRALLCEFNGNLVVKTGDHITGNAFYSFLGNGRANETMADLIELSKRERFKSTLKFIPEMVAEQLDPNCFSVSEVLGDADYILSVDRLVTYQGASLSSKRTEVRKFLKLHPESRFELRDLNCASTLEQLSDLFMRWKSRRTDPDACAADIEFDAFKRCLKDQAQLGIIGGAVFVGDTIAAVSLMEIVDGKFAYIHFEKADTADFPGISAFLNQEVAKFLAAKGIRYINIAEDLAVAGLRMNKRSYSPCAYLRKYSVDFCPATQTAKLELARPHEMNRLQLSLV